jgi:OmpR-family two-component system manganese-sensing response regulator
MAKILVVEDDKDLTAMVSDLLVFDKHIVEVAHTGLDGRDCLKMSKYDLIILDWDLPEVSGLELLKEFRANGGTTPVIFLTGKTTIVDKETGLDAGSDDYLTKPFHMKELSARVRSLLRRPPVYHDRVLRVRDIELDPNQHTVSKNGAEIKLFPKEFALLEFLMKHPNQIFSAESLLDHVWRSDSSASVDTVRQSLTRLRQGLDDSKTEPLIRTIYGVGYRLES